MAHKARLREELREPFFAFVAACVVLAALLLANPPPEEYDAPAEFLDFEDLPQRTEDEDAAAPGAVANGAIGENGDATESAAPSWLEYTIRRGDTMAHILDKIGADREARDFLLAQKLKSYRLLRRGDRLQFRLEDGRLAALRYKTSPEYYLRAGRGADGEWAGGRIAARADDRRPRRRRHYRIVAVRRRRPRRIFQRRD